jgi:hypothetical protein
MARTEHEDADRSVDTEAEEAFAELPEDHFYHGVIQRLFRGRQAGVIRSSAGREVQFVFLHVNLLGGLRRFDELREGMPVQFDVGWTSNGLRVTALRPRDDVSSPAVADPQET